MCGVGEGRFRECLDAAAEMAQQCRGKEDLPKLFHRKNSTVRDHVVMQCRVVGLRRCIAATMLPELGGDAWVHRATAELERLLALTPVQAAKACEDLPLGLRGEAGYKAGNDVPSQLVALFRSWLRTDASELMQAPELWATSMFDRRKTNSCPAVALPKAEGA